VFQIYGDRLLVIAMPSPAHRLTHEGRWTPAAIGAALDGHLVEPPRIADFVEELA
jgi:hypothetical protein